MYPRDSGIHNVECYDAYFKALKQVVTVMPFAYQDFDLGSWEFAFGAV